MNKIVLGLSGGVDSAVCGALLKKEGFEVCALYLDIGTPGGERLPRETAMSLGISFESLDIRREINELVIMPFCEAYVQGRTPNPCILCNPNVKFAALCKYADAIGAEYISTGHYARVSRENGRALLLRAKSGNDQSYMLCGLKRDQLERLILPLGECEKGEVRGIAREMGLEAAERPDSMEVCFVPDGDYAGFIENRGMKPPAGNFVNRDGELLGVHRGIHRYTVGQRRGLGIALGERMYVSEIRAEENEVVLSKGGGLYVTEFAATGATWFTDERVEKFKCTVRVRHSRLETPAVAERGADGVFVRTEILVRAPAPGQSVAFYDGDILLGGAVIV